MEAETTYDPGGAPVSAQKSYDYDTADRLLGAGLAYDSYGRMTSIPTAHSGGGVLSYTYYANDQVRTISQDGVSKVYTLDPAGRHYRTELGGGATHTERLHYGDGGDSATLSVTVEANQEAVSAQRYIEGIDGDLAAVRDINIDPATDETVLHLSNLHGDTIATASLDPEATQLLDRFESDEFGNPRQAAGAEKRYGWLGAKQRRTELASGVIQMGVRSYLPALGRFSSVDPVRGGSANDYDYANQDPINQFDLDGRVAGCGVRIQKWKSARKGKARLKARWNCPASAWPGEVTVHKMVITIEREVKGTLRQILKGKFETDRKPYVMKPYAKSQHRHWGVNSLESCSSGTKYQVKVEVFATLQSPTGMGGGTRTKSSRKRSIMTCRWKSCD